MPQVPQINAVGFNYGALPEEATQRTVKGHTQAIRLLVSRTSECYVEIGRRLTAVKEIVGRHLFQAWVNAELKWSLVMANNLINIAKQFGDLECLEHIDPSAILRLSCGRIPTAVVDEVIERAKSGHRFSCQDAIALRKKFAKPRASHNPLDSLRKSIDLLADQLGRRFMAEQLREIAGQLEKENSDKETIDVKLHGDRTKQIIASCRGNENGRHLAMAGL